MLTEALTWLLTPASATARRTGLLAESIAISARYRRCRAAWADHLANSRSILATSAERSARRRTAIVLGSGPLLDVPLDRLAARFDQVWLVDIVQPWTSRLRAARFRNVRLIELDVTACLARMPDAPPRPDLFLDRDTVDWVASVNLLSQLARAPQSWLRAHRPELGEAAIARYGDGLIERHLEWLERFSAPVCLLTDIEQTRLDANGQPLEYRDLRPFLETWRLEDSWRWDIAPPGELADGQSAFHRVAAFVRPGAPEQALRPLPASETPGRC